MSALRWFATVTAVAIASSAILTAPAAADKPAAAVSMGDSFISGEAAGSYEPGTDQSGNFCHRSTISEINMIDVPGIDARINLACSGATTENVKLGGVRQYADEAPQAEKLRAVVRDYDIKVIVLNIGANDVGFTSMVFDCIRGYFLLGPRCQDIWGPQIPAKMSEAAPKISQNIADIRTVMRDAGYTDIDYELVLQSYSSPVTEQNRYTLTKLFHGCPVRVDDAQWARESLVPQFTTMIGGVAAENGVRFLDMGPALHGREVCAKGITHAQEWARGITIDLTQIQNGFGLNIVRQSLHPNATGHAQFGKCLSSFLLRGVESARCVRGNDGDLAAVPNDIGAMTAVVPPLTVPRIAEAAPPEAAELR